MEMESSSSSNEILGSSNSFRLQSSNSFLRRVTAGGSRSLRLPTSDYRLGSKIAGRSQSSRLFLESVPAEYAAATVYERISSDEDGRLRRKDGGVWRSLLRAFSVNDGRKAVKEAATASSVGVAKEKKKKKKRRSSWLPDPDKRWPLQGW